MNSEFGTLEIVRLLVAALAAGLGYYSVDLALRRKLAHLRAAVDTSYGNALGDDFDIDGGVELLASRARERIFIALGAVTLIALLLVGIRLFVLPDFNMAFVGSWQPIAALLLGASVRSIGANTELLRREAEFRAVAATRKLIVERAGGEAIDQETIAQHARVVREHDRFSRNLGVAFEVKFVDLGGAGIFGDMTWTLEPGINVLLGRNGYGKSFLLRLIAALVSNDSERLNQLVPPAGHSHRMMLSMLRDGEPVAIRRRGAGIDTEQGRIPLLAIPDSRFISRARNAVGDDSDGEYADLARFGAHHFLRDMPFESTINTVLSEMCIEALRASPSGKLPSTPQLDLVASLIRELSGEPFRFFSIEAVGSARFAILVETDASPGKPIPIQHASQGTMSVVAICALIYQFLRSAHPRANPKELCEKPGLVIVDEVDAHLHPAWQRKIVYLLRSYFPHVQFILTAHSPLVVAGCGAGEISVLRRDGDSLKVREFQRDFIGARPEDIYREVFEIEERDAAYMGLQAQLPQLSRLREELDHLKNSGATDKEILDKSQTVRAIARTRESEEVRLEIDALRREHEQMTRQLEAARREHEQTEQLVAALREENERLGQRAGAAAP